MAKGGTKTVTQSTNSDPWKKAQPGLEYGMNEALDMYKSGVGSQPFTGSTVVPYSDQSMKAFDNIESLADGSQGYMTGHMDTLNKYASGDYLDGSNNPHFRRVLDTVQDDVQNRVNMGAAASGRYASPTHTGEMTRNLGDVTAKALSNNYQNEVQNMFNAGQQLPASFAAAMAPSQALLGVGGAMEDLYHRQVQDKVRIFDDVQNKPWDNLSRFMALAGGAGQMGGNVTQTSSQPRDWGSTFGNVMAGAGYLGNLFL